MGLGGGGPRAKKGEPLRAKKNGCRKFEILYDCLKVHTIENFFDSDFGICVDWAIIGGGTIFRVVLGLRGMKKNFELGPKFFFLLQFWTLNMTQY